MKYLQMLVEELHSTTVATMGADGHPQTKIIACIVEDVQIFVRSSV